MTDCNEIVDKNIPGILIVTHGRFGEEMIKSAEMIVGPLECVHALSLMSGMDPDDLINKVANVLKTMPEGSLIISDLFGGTPSNVSAAISKTQHIYAVSGLCLSMLIEAVSSRTILGGEALAEAVVKAGREGCQNVLAVLREFDKETADSKKMRG